MNNLKSNLLSSAKFFIGWPLAIISLFFILKLILSNSSGAISSIKDFNPILLLISVLCFFGYFIFRSLSWQKIIEQKGSKVGFKENSYLWSVSELKRYTPGNIWSFLSRSYLFSDKGLSKKELWLSMLIEIELIVISCMILSIPAVFLLSKNNLLSLLFILLTLVLTLFFIFNAKILAYFPQSNRLTGKLKAFLPKASPLSNLYLFLFEFFSFLFFGLGTYFSTVSIISLNLTHIDTFVSLFVFSLLVGYLSLITPMGLGVREGVMTYGLSRYITFSLAGLASIFSRIVFIISEVIYLFLIFLWHKSKNKIILKAENYITNHKYELVLLGAILIYIAYFTTASFLRYDNFYTGRFDLGNMDQAVWNTTHGRIFQITDPNGTNIISRLAFHADFILVLLAPLYLIWSSPEMLLLLQTVVLALGAIFVYLISKEILKNKNISLIFSLSYLLNPSMQYTNLYDFHPVTLGTTFLLIAAYCFIKRRYLIFLIFAVLAGLTKEEVWLIISVFGFLTSAQSVFALVKNKVTDRRKEFIKIALGGLLFAVSFGIFYYLVWYLIPSVRGGNHFALAYYSDFGYSPSSIVKNMIFSPFKTLDIIFSKNQLSYLLQQFIPLGFLSIFSPVSLLFAAPDLIIDLLSTNPQLHEIYFQYTSTITPFIFISAIYGVRRLRNWLPKVPVTFYCFFIIIATIFSAYIIGPLPGAKSPNLAMFTQPLADRNAIDKFLTDIPPHYSIAATNNIGSHLSHRQKIFTIPVGMKQADIVAFLLNDPYAQPSLPAQIKMAKEMENDKNYIQIFKQGKFIAFEKKNLYISSKPKIKQPKLLPFSLTALEHREYPGSNITVDKTVSTRGSFSSYIVSYLSDGLKLYALMDVPNGPKPQNGYPVVIVDHGYIPPTRYSTTDSYKEVTDYFASNGYLVLKPDYRGNGNSEIEETALMRFAYPIDVMNLLVSVNKLQQANSNEIYLWGHSMGGEVTLKVLEIIGENPKLLKEVKSAVLWAPVIDPLRWFSKSHLPLLEESRLFNNPYADTFKIMGTPESNPTLWESVSQLKYLPDIKTPVQINQGEADTTVPPQNSVELYNDFINQGKTAFLITYPGNGHNLTLSFNTAIQNSLNFFNQYK